MPIRTLGLLELRDPRLFEREDDAALEILRDHDGKVRELVRSYRAREVEKCRGFLLLFERPLDAVAFCLAYHEGMRDAAFEGRPLRGRAAVHLGEVRLWDNPPEHVERGAKPFELAGVTRSVLVQIAALAGPGQTLVTRTVRDLSRRAAVGSAVLPDEVEWRSHGVFSFTADERLEIFEVGVEGTAPFVAPEPRPPEAAADWRPAAGQPLPFRPHWILERQLDPTGFGELWLAVHRKTRDRHAFHFALHADETPRLERQLALLRGLREAPGDTEPVLRPVDAHLGEAPPCIELDFVASSALESWAEEQGGLAAVALGTRLELVAQLADALVAVHDAGAALGDLRPANLRVVERRDRPPRLLLGDLSAGAASPPEEDLPALGTLLFQVVAGDWKRRPGPFWERDVEDELLREEIAGLLEPDAARRSDPAGVARRLRAFDARRAEREQQRYADARREAEKIRRGRLLAAAAALLLTALGYLLGRLL